MPVGAGVGPIRPQALGPDRTDSIASAAEAARLESAAPDGGASLAHRARELALWRRSARSSGPTIRTRRASNSSRRSSRTQASSRWPAMRAERPLWSAEYDHRTFLPAPHLVAAGPTRRAVAPGVVRRRTGEGGSVRAEDLAGAVHGGIVVGVRIGSFGLVGPSKIGSAPGGVRRRGGGQRTVEGSIGRRIVRLHQAVADQP